MPIVQFVGLVRVMLRLDPDSSSEIIEITLELESTLLAAVLVILLLKEKVNGIDFSVTRVHPVGMITKHTVEGKS